MRSIVNMLSLALLASSSVARGEEPMPKVDLARIRAKEAQVQELQNELGLLRQQAGLVKQVLLKIRVVEVDVTLLRKSGIDFRIRTPEGVANDKQAEIDAVAKKLKLNDDAAAGNSNAMMHCGALPAGHAFFAFLDALEKQGLATSLCAPSLIAESGVPASFRAGGEFPLSAGPNAQNVSMKFYGTSADVVAFALAEQHVRVNIRVGISTIDESRAVTSGGVKIPALKIMEFNTGFEGRLGETLMTAGLTQEREVADQQAGAGASKSKQLFQQLLLVTPEAVGDAVARQPENGATRRESRR